MIVVGSCGEAPLRAVIIGSTPHRLIHVTSVPVLVVRGEAVPEP
jgi:nucleotide-binding universal stress UspA family protein